jgi:large subunit ribosomal protein L49
MGILAPMRYFVHRTVSRALPVYTDYRNGRTRRLTIIRKVDGDAQQLRADLIKELEIPQEHVTVNKLNGHVTVKGIVARDVTEWLSGKGF